MATFAPSSFVDLSNLLLPTRSKSWGSALEYDPFFFPPSLPELRRFPAFGPVAAFREFELPATFSLMEHESMAYLPPGVQGPSNPAPSELSEVPSLESGRLPSPVKEPEPGAVELSEWQCPSNLKAQKKRAADERRAFQEREAKREAAGLLAELARKRADIVRRQCEAKARKSGVSESAIAAQRRADARAAAKPKHSDA